MSGGEIKAENGSVLGHIPLSTAQYTPNAGQRYVWTTAQTFTKTITTTYRQSTWLGLINWNPGSIYEQNSVPSTPTTLRIGDYGT